ncbi:hypothetical protein C8R45DRAFT_1069726 [Mycena sanguinolenta]|nr:hypothetical protein C8R45DRAFT_1069726 [Mycena sanguinolenta]
MSSNSLPTLLAEAVSRREQAHRTLYTALDAPDAEGASPEYLEHLNYLLRITLQTSEDARAARSAADTAAILILWDILTRHGVQPGGLDGLVSAMHRDSFADLAQLGDSAHFSGEVILALRDAWRRHHQQAQPMPGFHELDDQVARRIRACATFGDVARILEDELHVSDQTFYNCWSFWKSSRKVMDPAVAPNGLCDAFQNITLS